MSYEQQHGGKSPADVITELHELAINRCLEQINFDYRDYLSDEELLAYQEAERWDTAHLTPEPTEPQVQAVGKVVIEVYGGVADVTSKPDGIEVEIIDLDNDSEEHGGSAPGFASALDHFLEKVDMPQESAHENE